MRKYGNRYCLTVIKSMHRHSITSTIKPDKPALTAKDASSIRRARRRVFELASCNAWEYFVTLTLDPQKYDRYDLGKFRRDLSVWISNQRRLHGCAFQYLLIPERHKDGAWHMHGLVAGLREGALEYNGNGYLDYPPYRNRFGYISLSRVRSIDAVSRYITKYISKSLSSRLQDVGDHLFFASRGLKGAEIVANGIFRPPEGFRPDYENEWMWELWLDSPIELEEW